MARERGMGRRRSMCLKVFKKSGRESNRLFVGESNTDYLHTFVCVYVCVCHIEM